MISDEITRKLIIFGLAFVPALLGIVCHEVAHGYAAFKMGDPTAKYLGRLTLNPIKHLDPMGFGMFVFTAMFLPFVIGWAKPVPVNARYFKNPRKGMVLVSFAGPLTNFVIAIVCALVAKLAINLDTAGIGTGSLVLEIIESSAKFGILINCALGWFNLMPIPPLDGSHILAGLLPPPIARFYASIGKYGLIIFALLLMTGVFGMILMPLVQYSNQFIWMFAGL